MFDENNIENIIIKKLQYGPQKTIDLIKRIKNVRPKTTKQAVYLILRKLKEKEAININKKIVSLNTLWIRRLSEFVKTANQTYFGNSFVSEYFTNLKEREKIRYYFNDSKQMDSFWAHVLITLLEISSVNAHDFVYAPHYWFYIARRESEDDFYKIFLELNKKAFILIGNDTFLDRDFKKNSFNKNVQIHTISSSEFKKNNYYMNVVGDYIIEVLMDENISKKINEFYSKTREVDSLDKEELKRIISQLGKSKFVISRNKAKAKRMKNKFKKYFFIK